MTNERPTIEQVTEVLRRLSIAHGWIGEGEDIVNDLLAWIDGESAEIQDWALALCPDCGASPQRPEHHRLRCLDVAEENVESCHE